jgi:hypothetical protein
MLMCFCAARSLTVHALSAEALRTERGEASGRTIGTTLRGPRRSRRACRTRQARTQSGDVAKGARSTGRARLCPCGSRIVSERAWRALCARHGVARSSDRARLADLLAGRVLESARVATSTLIVASPRGHGPCRAVGTAVRRSDRAGCPNRARAAHTGASGRIFAWRKRTIEKRKQWRMSRMAR